MEELKDRVKHLRIALKIGSQEKLAEILNVNGARVKSIETGRVKDLTAQEANILVKNFNLDIDWLLTGKGEMLLNEPQEPQKQNEQTEEEQELLANFKALPPDLQSIYMKEIELEALKEARKKRQNNITAPTAKSKSSIA